MAPTEVLQLTGPSALSVTHRTNGQQGRSTERSTARAVDGVVAFGLPSSIGSVHTLLSAHSATPDQRRRGRSTEQLKCTGLVCLLLGCVIGVNTEMRVLTEKQFGFVQGYVLKHPE